MTVLAEAQCVVIGGGIAGLSCAWYLARDGVDVVLVEAGDLGAQASGANAGSLHLQIQYPEFASYGEGWARAYAPTLRFLAASIEMWRDLSAALDEDLQVKLAGGLVVATTEAQMRLIEAKARIEATVGVETEILDRNALLAEAPYLSDIAIGGGFCRREGKANPLRTTPAIADAAERAGVRIYRDTSVTGIVRSATGYSLDTPRGALRAGRIVNAAGARAGDIARMLGLDIAIAGFPIQVTITEPVASFIPHLVYSAAGKLSLKQALNGGCVIGGGWPARLRADGGPVTDPLSLAANMVVAAGVAPVIAQARALRSWTAWVNGTPDWRPILGEVPGSPGAFLAIFPWVGFSAGPGTGRVIADLVQDRPPRLPLKGVSTLYD
ncbi:MAG: FAD-binding oxidoreductase [Pseudomonadota bacterium]